MVIDPHPKKRHRRFDEAALAQLESLRRGSPAEVLLQSFLAAGCTPIRDGVARSRLADDAAEQALCDLVAEGLLVVLEPGEPHRAADLLAWAAPLWQAETGRAERELEAYHRANPLRRGMPREELKSRLKIGSPRVYNAAARRWAADGILGESGSLVWRAGFEVKLNPQQQSAADRLLAKFAQNPFSPPSAKDAQAEVGDDLFDALVGLEALVAVSPDVVFRKEDYDRMVAMVREHFAREETLTVVQWRDRLNTSRRYVLAFLEHLDAAGVTVREGDARKLRKAR